MKLPMILVAFGPVFFLGFLVSFAQAFGNPLNYGANLEPGRLSGVRPRGSPPNYGPPSYIYGYPPPYEYETSTSTATWTTRPDSSTFVTSVTTISTAVLTITDQPPSTSGKYSISTHVLTVTMSPGTEPESTSSPIKSDPWVKSSALGVTGASTSSISTEREHLSSAETEATNSKSMTGPHSLSSHESAATTTLTSDTVVETNNLTSNAEDTSTRLGTATITNKVTVTNSVVSSTASLESSKLPITASWTSTDDNSTTSATSNSIITITQIVTSTQNGHFNASSGVSSWSSPSEGTRSPSISRITRTVTVSSQETVTTVFESASSESTRAEETHTSSYSVSRDSVGSSKASTTETDSIPRTKSYFSSVWANSTIGSATAVISSLVATQGSSLPGSVSSLVSPGTFKGTISSGSSGPPFPVPSNSTISPSKSSALPWMSSSVLGTVVSPISSKQSIKISGKSSALTTKTITLESTLPPFQNTTTTSFNISHHSPWKTTIGQARTITSIVSSSLPSHSTKNNSTDRNSSPTSSPRIASSRTRFTYWPSSIPLSTEPASSETTKALPPFPIPSNATSPQQTLPSNTIFTSFFSSSAFASSSAFSQISPTDTRNATFIRTLTKKLTSTIRVSPNSTTIISQSEQSSSMSATAIGKSGSAKISIFTGTSAWPSTLTVSLVTSVGDSSSTSTPRWTNSTSKSPISTSFDIPGTATESSKRIPVTTGSTLLSSRGTQGVNFTTNRLTDSISSQTGTVSPSEITLWPTNKSSFTGTESRQPGPPSAIKSTALYPNTTKTGMIPTATYTDHSGVEVTTVTLAPICTDIMVNSSSSIQISSVSTRCTTFDNGTATMTRCLALPNSNDPGVTSLSNILSNLDPVPTTFSTLTRSGEDSSGPESPSPSHAQPTDKTGSQPETNLPNNPNFPWGSDSPIHRHQSVTQLGAGVAPGGIWRRRTKEAVRKMKAYLV